MNGITPVLRFLPCRNLTTTSQRVQSRPEQHTFSFKYAWDFFDRCWLAADAAADAAQITISPQIVAYACSAVGPVKHF